MLPSHHAGSGGGDGIELKGPFRVGVGPGGGHGGGSRGLKRKGAGRRRGKATILDWEVVGCRGSIALAYCTSHGAKHTDYDSLGLGEGMC